VSPSPNGEDTTPSSPYQLPAPGASSPQVQTPTPVGSPFTAPGPVPDTSWGGQPYPGSTAVDASAAPDAHPTFPGAPTSLPASFPVPGPGHDEREHRPGTNGLAIAALCCGIAGFVPFAAVVAIVLGIVALSQLKRVVQAGRGMAIAGIVLGALWIAGFAALIAIGIATDSSDSGGSRPLTSAGRDVTVDELKAGDCFNDGSTPDSKDVGDVTVVPCTTPHRSQVVTVFDLPAGRYPGEDKVVAAADKGCSDKADPLVREDRMAEVEPSYIYPSDAWTWSHSRAIQCTADATTGKVTGSVLK
jgi:hypothetical protein